MKQYREIQRLSDVNEQYPEAKRSIGICLNSNQNKILIYGENALSLINHFSVSKVDDKIVNNFYTIFLNKKKFISEVLILRLSIYRYLLITPNFEKIYKILKKAKKRYPNTVVYSSYNEYSLFSFHGDNADLFFQNLDYRYIFKTKHQNYTYYQLLVPKKDEKITFNHFVNLNFVPISIDVNKLFLYNNNVILQIDKIPRRLRLSVCNELYHFENFKIKTKSVHVCKYELEGNYLVTNKHKVYNYMGKKTGIVHCTYRLPNKKYPFIIALILKDQTRKVSLIKIDKNDALIKPIFNY